MEPAAVVRALERGELRCVDEACKQVALPAGPGWAVGASWTVGADQVVRADLRDARGIGAVWLRLAPDGRVLVAATLRGDPAAELGAGPLLADPWAAHPRCRAAGAGECASLLQQAARAGATLRPLATWADGDRRLALVDFVVAGRPEDRVWLYAVGDAAAAEVVGVDEDEAHGPLWLAGRVPGDGGAALPPDAALQALAARWCAGEVPAGLADRSLGACTVQAAGAIDGLGAVCLALPSGDHLTARVRGAEVTFGGYGLDCALKVRDLY